MEIIFLGILPVFPILFLFLISGLRVINQYEKGLILTFGKYSSTRGPGLNWIFPVVQSMIKVDMRTRTVDIPKQEAITKDNVPVGINGVVYFKVENAELAILEIQSYMVAVSQYSQAALRDVTGSVELDTLLAERDRIADEIKKIVDQATGAWGVNVLEIKIQDIELPADMKRIMARQAETERERRSAIIRAQGELSASEDMKKAAVNLASVPGGMTLRTLKAIESTATSPSQTIIYALPLEVMEGIKSISEHFAKK
ncbi:MAG: slipin family protein [bacterium]